MIRQAIPEDCANLAVLAITVWIDTYAVDGIKGEYSTYVLSNFTEEKFLSLLDSAERRVLVSECDGVLQAFALINLHSHFDERNNGFEIEKLYVDRRFKGKGLGRELLAEIEDKFGQIFWLYTWVENESNGFYEHMGLKRIGRLSFDFNGKAIENHVYRKG
jgi:GNAT superfamily N-acetyltransferase